MKNDVFLFHIYDGVHYGYEKIEHNFFVLQNT